MQRMVNGLQDVINFQQCVRINFMLVWVSCVFVCVSRYVVIKIQMYFLFKIIFMQNKYDENSIRSIIDFKSMQRNNRKLKIANGNTPLDS